MFTSFFYCNMTTINERNLDDQHTLTYTENDLHETINKKTRSLYKTINKQHTVYTNKKQWVKFLA